MELNVSFFIVYAVHGILFPLQLINFLSRKSDATRWRYLMLTTIYLVLNTVWFFTEYLELTDSLILDFIGTVVAVTTFGYTYYYMLIETGLGNLNNGIRKWLGTVLIIILLMETANWSFSQDFKIAFYWLVFCFSEIIAILFAIKLISQIRNLEDNLSPIYYASIVASCAGCFLPVVIIWGNSITLKHIAANSPFLVISFAYVLHHIEQMRKESEVLKLENDNSNLNRRYKSKVGIDENQLTEREKEIAHLMISGQSYKQIAESLYITYSGARKHGSNIYAKTGVQNLKEFREKAREGKISL